MFLSDLARREADASTLPENGLDSKLSYDIINTKISLDYNPNLNTFNNYDNVLSEEQGRKNTT